VESFSFQFFILRWNEHNLVETHIETQPVK
jgi:hypothetical protein